MPPAAVLLRLDEALLARVDLRARAEGVSRSSLLRRLVEAGLDATSAPAPRPPAPPSPSLPRTDGGADLARWVEGLSDRRAAPAGGGEALDL